MGKSFGLYLDQAQTRRLIFERRASSLLGLQLREVFKRRSQKVLESPIEVILYLHQSLDLSSNADLRSEMQASGFGDLVEFFDANIADAKALSSASANLKKLQAEVKELSHTLDKHGQAFSEAYQSAAKSACRIEGNDFSWSYMDEAPGISWTDIGTIACDWAMDSGHVEFKLAKSVSQGWLMAIIYSPSGDFDESPDVFEEIIEAPSLNGLLDFIQYHSALLDFWKCLRLLVDLEFPDEEIKVLRRRIDRLGVFD